MSGPQKVFYKLTLFAQRYVVSAVSPNKHVRPGVNSVNGTFLAIVLHCVALYYIQQNIIVSASLGLVMELLSTFIEFKVVRLIKCTYSFFIELTPGLGPSQSRQSGMHQGR